MMSDLELDRILTLEWPCLVRRVMAGGADNWVKGFVLSIAKQGKRPSWKPSQKQAAMMRRLLSELSRSPQVEEEIELIER